MIWSYCVPGCVHENNEKLTEESNFYMVPSPGFLRKLVSVPSNNMIPFDSYCHFID